MSFYSFTVRGSDDANALAKATAKIDEAIAGAGGFPALPEHVATRSTVLATIEAFLAVVPDDPGADICVDVHCSIEKSHLFPTELAHTGANIIVRAHLALRENP